MGVNIDARLKFSTHINNICIKSGRNLNALKRVAKSLPINVKLLLYKTYICRVISTSVLWSGTFAVKPIQKNWRDFNLGLPGLSMVTTKVTMAPSEKGLICRPSSWHGYVYFALRSLNASTTCPLHTCVIYLTSGKIDSQHQVSKKCSPKT